MHIRYLLLGVAVSLLAATVVDGRPISRSLPRDLLDDGQSPASESDLLCNLCEEHLAPAVLRAVIESEKHHNTAETMDDVMQRVLQDTESHVHQPVFHEYLQRLLWSIETMRSFSAIQRLYHEHPDRAHLLEYLVDHVVCSCRAHTWEHDRAFSRLLERHAAIMRRELRDHIDRDGVEVIPSLVLAEEEQEAERALHAQLIAMQGGEAPSTQQSQDYKSPEMTLGGMPGFGGMATGAERQGAEL